MSEPDAALPRMSLPEHLDELRTRLLRSVLVIVALMVGVFFFYDAIWAFAQQPYLDAAERVGVKDPRLVAIAPGEAFLGSLKLCFLASVVLAGPFVLWQMWGFVSAGLYEHERRSVRVFFPVSIVLFGLGLVAAYKLLIPFGLRFLLSWNVELAVASSVSVSEYLSTCLTMVFAMGILFELPLVMLFVQATDLVARKTLQKGWRVAVLLSFVLGMFLTDPSPVTQIMMAIPVIGLYMLGLWGGRFVGEGAERFTLLKAWPLALGAAGYVALIIFSDQLNDLAASAFGSGEPPPATEQAPAEPGGN